MVYCGSPLIILLAQPHQSEDISSSKLQIQNSPSGNISLNRLFLCNSTFGLEVACYVFFFFYIIASKKP